MVRKPVLFAYGIKLILTWMLIPLVIMFIPLLGREFSYKMTTQEVTLLKETYSMYPDEYKCFEADINGRTMTIQAPVTSEPGDTVTVILRNGEYYITPKDAEILKTHTTFMGRFLKVTNINIGYHVVGFAAALLITFLITVKNRKTIRSVYPKLSKVTDIIGIILSVIMSAALLFAAIENTLDGVAIAYLSFFAGMIYMAVFVIIWAVGSAISHTAKQDVNKTA